VLSLLAPLEGPNATVTAGLALLWWRLDAVRTRGLVRATEETLSLPGLELGLLSLLLLLTLLMLLNLILLELMLLEPMLTPRIPSCFRSKLPIRLWAKVTPLVNSTPVKGSESSDPMNRPSKKFRGSGTSAPLEESVEADDGSNGGASG
jgi:hypothetical protein